ncbi:hypothetical protein LCGC14_1826730, partial [marine sediment metagenome]
GPPWDAVKAAFDELCPNDAAKAERELWAGVVAKMQTPAPEARDAEIRTGVAVRWHYADGYNSACEEIEQRLRRTDNSP